MTARFEIKLAKNGEYMFNLIAPNGKVVCTSETYTTLQNCKNGIASIKTNAASHVQDTTAVDAPSLLCPKYEVFLDREDKFRFRLIASNGEIICASQGYTTKASAYGGIESIKENAPEAAVVVLE